MRAKLQRREKAARESCWRNREGGGERGARGNRTFRVGGHPPRVVRNGYVTRESRCLQSREASLPLLHHHHRRRLSRVMIMHNSRMKYTDDIVASTWLWVSDEKETASGGGGGGGGSRERGDMTPNTTYCRIPTCTSHTREEVRTKLTHTRSPAPLTPPLQPFSAHANIRNAATSLYLMRDGRPVGPAFNWCS